MSDLSADPVITASMLGLEVVIPEDDELFIDIDNPEDELFMNEMIKTLRSNDVIVNEVKQTTSKNDGKHIYLKVIIPETITPIERICLQACLGSDRKRELLSLLRIMFSLDRPPTVFFEVPESARIAQEEQKKLLDASSRHLNPTDEKFMEDFNKQ